MAGSVVGWLHLLLPCLWALLGFPQELGKRSEPGASVEKRRGHSGL